MISMVRCQVVTCLMSAMTLVTQVTGQAPTHPVKLGDIVHNFLFPPNELIGGLERVIDDVSNLDDRHLSCGKRQVCEAMSLGQALERNDERISMKDLRLEEQLFIERMMLYEKMKNAPEDGLNAIKRKATSKDKFNNYCRDMNQKEIEKILKSVNITVNPTAVTEDYDYENYEAGSGDY